MTTKKTTKKNNSTADNINVSDDADLDKLPVGKQITKTISVRAEDLKRDDAEDADAEDADDAELEGEDFFDEDLSDGFFDEDTGIEFVEVYRIVGGSLRGKGKMPFVDNFPISPTLRADIREACGGGTFVVLHRGIDPATNRARILRRKTIEIEGAPKDYNPPAAQPAPLPVIPVQPAPQSNAGSDLDIALTALEKLDALAQRRRTLMREPNPAPVAPAAPALQPPDPAESFLEQFDKFTTISEKLAPSREEKRGGIVGFMEGAAQIIDAVGKHAPSLLGFLATMAQRQQPNGAPQQPAQPAPPSQNAAAMNPAPVNPVMDTLRTIVEDLKADRRVARSADAITNLAESDEQLGAMLGALLQRPEADILRELSQVAVEDLSAYPHAVSWIGELKFELLPDEEEGDEETPEGEGEAKAEAKGDV